MTRRRGYGQFCPVARASEVIAERWTPLVLRELLAGTTRFSQLRRGIPLISPAVLSQRLKALQDAGVLERRRGAAGEESWEYQLSPAGESLRPIIEQLGAWGRRWIGEELRREDLDPRFILWALHRHPHPEALPAAHVVLQIELQDGPVRRRRWWIVVDQGEVDLCLKHPGHQVDLVISAAGHTLVRLFLGQLDVHTVLASNALTLSGAPSLVRSFARWYPRSPAARADRTGSPAGNRRSTTADSRRSTTAPGR